jgi:hypothetical protein
MAVFCAHICSPFIVNPKLNSFLMKQMHALFLLLCLLGCVAARAQKTEIKKHDSVLAGEVHLISSYGEMRNGVATRVFEIQAPVTAYYYLQVYCNRRQGEKLQVHTNDYYFMGELNPGTNGWQWMGQNLLTVKLFPTKTILRFTGSSNAVPMADEIRLTRTNPWRVMSFVGSAGTDEPVSVAKTAPAEETIAVSKTWKAAGDITERVLPNPEGTYNHAIDTSFNYSHFSWIYLTAGVHNFGTSNSTVNRSLAIFNPNNYTESWSNVNGGAGGESAVTVGVSTPGYYAIALRPVADGQVGLTNIMYNGNTLVAKAVVGGRLLTMSALKGGDLNHFTCKLTGVGADTRMMVSRYAASSVRGYNDDYSGGGGTWNWLRSSRIKKNFNGVDSVQYGFVCAYSPSTGGVCDIYLGNQNSNVYNTNYPEFPLHTADDAIMTAPATGNYNCIAWSGGVTTSWVWPPGQLSTYSCTSANYLQCFDNFYSNNPVRYPGAWNYTRFGATYGNSVVDLWKQPAGGYQHASVRKPGNDHPHGYDWESKPGGTARTLHPRHALENVNWYGVVNDYYRPTGSFARMAGAGEHYATDADAVKAGIAVFDKGILTRDGNDKLARLVKQVDAAFVREFDEKYMAWDKTKAANATLSDPSMYCKNAEHEALVNLGKRNAFACLVLVMDKFVNAEDHLMGDLLIALSKEKYGKLLDEVKAERLAKPTDEQGRHKIHGDHDNGVLYIEKILRQLEAAADIKPVFETVSVTASPNPVTDVLIVKVKLTSAATVSIRVMTSQTRMAQVMQKQINLPAGEHQFAVNTQTLTRTTGDIITVQATVNGQLHTVKVLKSN